MRLDTTNFSDDLIWIDEMEWEPVEQSHSYNVDGSLEIETEANLKQGGRPITLKGTRKYGLVKRSTVLELKALSAVPGKTMELELRDGRTFQVAFASGEKKVVAQQVFLKSRPQSTDLYTLELYLMEVLT